MKSILISALVTLEDKLYAVINISDFVTEDTDSFVILTNEEYEDYINLKEKRLEDEI